MLKLDLGLDRDFAFDVKESSGRPAPRARAAWLVLPRREVGTPIWNWSVIMKGSVTDVPALPALDARQQPRYPDGEKLTRRCGLLHKAAYTTPLGTSSCQSADWAAKELTGCPRGCAMAGRSWP